jgi:uncharacterized protein
MAWLLLGDRVVATVEVAESARSRTRGLLGRDGVDGALLLQPAKSVHTIGMRFPIDVAYLDADLVVLDIVTMARHRIGRPRWRANAVLEAEAGAFGHWGIARGDQLTLRP